MDILKLSTIKILKINKEISNNNNDNNKYGERVLNT